jgi:hypothetical protein
LLLGVQKLSNILSKRGFYYWKREQK